MKLYSEITDEQRDDRFFRETTAACFGASTQAASVRWVVVSHVVADIVPFLEALSKIGTVASVIPKQHSIDRDILKQLKNSGYPIHESGRTGIHRQDFLTELFKQKGRYIIVDIGGYFATAQLPQYAAEKLLGIIECTENGHQKYERLLSAAAYPYPVFSIARSPLKESEDDLIGHSIGFYTEAILRRQYILPRFLTIGIIGYGKIGRGIASYLFGQHIKPLVFDSNPIRSVRAYKDGCLPSTREAMLEKCDLIFCATGAQSITAADFDIIKNGCFLASVTSADDEFGLSGNSKYGAYTFLPAKDQIQEVVGGGKRFFLLNAGNAVNFAIPGDRVGNFIRPIQAEVIAASKQLMSPRSIPSPPPLMRQVPQIDQEKIAKIFLDTYLSKEE